MLATLLQERIAALTHGKLRRLPMRVMRRSFLLQFSTLDLGATLYRVVVQILPTLHTQSRAILDPRSQAREQADDGAHGRYTSARHEEWK